MNDLWDLIVIGGGASGMMAAVIVQSLIAGFAAAHQA